MNVPRFFCLGKPALIFSVLLLAAGASWADVVTVAVSFYANYGYVSPNYNSQTLISNKSYSMTAHANSGFTFANWVFTDGSGIHTNTKAKLTFTNGVSFIANFTDKQKPKLFMTTPANNSSVSQSNVVVMGSVTDNDALAGVFYSTDSPTNFLSASTANGYKNWWVNLALNAGTNYLFVYAIDRSSNSSPVKKIKIVFAAAPNGVVGTTLTVDSQNYFITFSTGTNGTFSEQKTVGTYRYLKTGPESGKLWLNYIAPPSASNTDNVGLVFNSATGGTYTDVDDFTGSFIRSPAANLALTNLNGAQIVLSNSVSQTLLSFLDPPVVMGGISPIATNNPLTVLLSVPYPGNIGDRVAVTFSHLKDVNGSWVTNYPLTLSGSISGVGSISSINASTNIVSVLFDTPLYLFSHTDAFFPLVNSPLTLFTCYYADYTGGDTNVIANTPVPFSYTNFSPVGSLLKLKRNGTNEFFILTFDNPTNYSGTYYDEAYGIGVTVPVEDTGVFSIAAEPTIPTTGQPKDVNTTNGGTANFTVVASGSPTLQYQWMFGTNNLTDGSSGWGSTRAGSTSASLTISAVTTNDVGNYSVFISNPFNSITSSQAKLTVGIPPQITGPAAAVGTISTGSSTNFLVAAIGSQPLFYQWQFNGTNLPIAGLTNYSGVFTTNLVINLATTNNIGNYFVTVTNKYGSANGLIFNLTVTP